VVELTDGWDGPIITTELWFSMYERLSSPTDYSSTLLRSLGWCNDHSCHVHYERFPSGLPHLLNESAIDTYTDIIWLHTFVIVLSYLYTIPPYVYL
jgi:hypothetical protein